MSIAAADYAFALAACVKVAMIAAGILCVFMGFRLFTQGITNGGAKLGMSGEAGGWKAAVAMDRGGPGLIFALFGLIISVAAIFKNVAASVPIPGPPGSSSALGTGVSTATLVVQNDRPDHPGAVAMSAPALSSWPTTAPSPSASAFPRVATRPQGHLSVDERASLKSELARLEERLGHASDADQRELKMRIAELRRALAIP